MIKYVERKGTDCVKWDGLRETFGAEDLLPLWVADMDFMADEHIIQAMRDYVEAGVPGYYKVKDSYLDSFIDWEKNEHRLLLNKEWIRFTPGVVTGFNFAINVLTKPGDAVIVTTPVYYPFLNAVRNNERKLITSEMTRENGRYYIDFEDFESKIEENDVKAFIFCSPHNPVSRVWSTGEITRILDICRRNNVAVISDEIHHDLIFGGFTHVPTLSLAEEGDRIIMLTAASKTFNIAGLQNSFAVIKNDELRAAWDRFTTGINVTRGNPLGYIAVEAAYRYGKDWLKEVRDIIYANYEYVREVFAAELPDVVLTPLEGTYLAWADFGKQISPVTLQKFMQNRCGLAFDYGSWFGGGKSDSFIRINLATSRENIETMVRRITEGFNGKA